MQVDSWQKHLQFSRRSTESLVNWLEKIGLDDSALFSQFINDLWLANAQLFAERRSFESFFKSNKEISLFKIQSTTPSDLRVVLIKQLEELPYEWHDSQLDSYQNLFIQLVVEEQKNAFQLLKAFLAKTKVGVKFTFYENCIRRFEYDHELKMDVALLGIIRDDYKCHTNDLLQWEEQKVHLVNSCPSMPNEENCKAAIYALVPLAFLWRNDKPDKLLEKCMELGFLYNKTPENAVLQHLAIYVRQAMLNLGIRSDWKSLIEFNSNARDWVKDLSVRSLNHPKLEGISKELKKREELHAQNLFQDKGVKEVAQNMDSLTQE